ncbi:hypothetical protein [Nocardioides jensenii]|uniref:hypothetical protein n=1 Tax=Nocardioides jensenii TaxID=1843 RepID=UPI0008340650|nr:hypothetical protein [Nocardioides jensenii]
MKKSLITLALTATMGAVLAQSPALASAVPASVPTAAPTNLGVNAQAVNPYAGTAKWRLMSTASDVDGDGTIDGIWIRRKSANVCSVRVTRGPGQGATKDLYSSFGNPCVFHGDAPFDTVRGSEISVLTGLGAHTQWHSIVTWRDGRLVLERAPRNPRWTVDSTVMMQEGIRRTRNAAGEIRLAHTAVTRGATSRWSGVRSVYAYKGGTWVVTAKKSVAMTQAQASAISGWHVKFLPRFER